jgi:serine/threonine protein kinase
MSSAESFSVSQVEEVYTVDQRIRFKASKPNAITNELESMTFDIKITQQLAVGQGIRSQVLVVRIVNQVNNTLDVPLVAKFYDARFCPEVDFTEWPGGRLQLCAAMKTNESKAYQKLEPLQGSEIPKFLGEYTCCHPDNAVMRIGYPDAILLEFVDLHSLADIRSQDLSTNDRDTLKNRAFTVLSKIHSLGVYHRDLRPENMFWNRLNDLKLIDFDQATFNDGRTTEAIEQWITSDKGQLMSMLHDYNIEYEGPPPPEWFVKSVWE